MQEKSDLLAIDLQRQVQGFVRTLKSDIVGALYMTLNNKTCELSSLDGKCINTGRLSDLGVFINTRIYR